MVSRLLAGIAPLALAGCIIVPVVVPLGGTGPATELTQGTVDSFGALLNDARREAGVVPVVLNPALDAAAQAHAEDMAERGYFSHTSPEGRSHANRARAAGYRYCTLAENIAYGQPSEAAVNAGWLNSPDHRGNSLNPRVNEYGLGQAGDKWVLMLGRRC